jgi:serine protease Do
MTTSSWVMGDIHPFAAPACCERGRLTGGILARQVASMSGTVSRALLLACLLPAACAVAQPKQAPIVESFQPERQTGGAHGRVVPLAVGAQPVPRDPAALAALPKPPALPPGGDAAMNGGGAPPGRRTLSSGTGFVVAPGRVLTNAHVVESCGGVRVRPRAGQDLPVNVLARDADADLALLAVEGDPGPPLAFRGAELRRGEGVVTYGFPLAGLLGSGPTLTTGEVSALSGLRDIQSQYQISAPVQAGNSGGPLFDLSGLVVGVVTSKLNAQRIAQTTGDIPQNVNFAVKSNAAVEFLRRNGVQPRIGGGGQVRSAADVGEIADPSTVFLRCLN